MGWQIVRHSLTLLMRNLGAALRASLGPTLIGLVAVVALIALFGAGLPGAADPASLAASGGAALASLLVLAVLLFVSSWVAVTWHRYVLLEEEPGWIPALGGRPVGPYLARTLILTLVVVLIAIPLIFVLSLALAPFLTGVAPGVEGADPAATAPGPATLPALLFAIGLGAIISWFWLRLGLILPGTAVGKPLRMGESWARTKPAAGAIFVATLILMGLNFVAAWVLGAVVGGNALGFVLQLVVNWISLMVGISILTTLYGHLVEGREIPS